MYNHILIPVQLDDSRDVQQAVKAAHCLATRDGRFTFLHAMEPLPTSIGTYLPEGYPRESREALRNELEDAASQVQGAQTVLTDGSAGRAITSWAEENSVDCIVIPSHQPTFTDVFLGSTAAWVVRHARCAVHVVR